MLLPGYRTLNLRQRNPNLSLILPTTILIRGLADFVRFKEQHLGAAFAGVDLGGERGGVAEFQGHVAFPLRFKWRDVDDDAAAGVGGFAQADGEHAAGDAEVLHGAGQRE